MRSGIAQIIRLVGMGVLGLSLLGSFAIAAMEAEVLQIMGEPWLIVSAVTFLTGAVISVVAGALIIGLSEIIELLAKIEYNTSVDIDDEVNYGYPNDTLEDK